MAENRLPRDNDNRERSARPTAWKPPELLPDPIREPGYSYRWIRVSLLNNADPKNYSAKLREGWEPVKLSEQPQFQLLTDPNSRFKDNIEVDGLLLCKTPTELVDQRNDYYANQAQSQVEAVDSSFMRQSDARMPLFKERKSEVSFGKGK